MNGPGVEPSAQLPADVLAEEARDVAPQPNATDLTDQTEKQDNENNGLERIETVKKNLSGLHELLESVAAKIPRITQMYRDFTQEYLGDDAAGRTKFIDKYSLDAVSDIRSGNIEKLSDIADFLGQFRYNRLPASHHSIVELSSEINQTDETARNEFASVIRDFMNLENYYSQVLKSFEELARTIQDATAGPLHPKLPLVTLRPSQAEQARLADSQVNFYGPNALLDLSTFYRNEFRTMSEAHSSGLSVISAHFSESSGQ